ncbi:efflux RND transporter periplasmic adaptor subunit [Paracoccus luteus]|uniref:efflux RND transporter periplasmic adaptor subunit n=1 Tax=Paracoccus luteus TaxID=2508543 RepID=UPI00106F7CF8|nr:efflux RND transporter periplasmic adaptor subunit [Paracoccus luteus]
MTRRAGLIAAALALLLALPVAAAALTLPWGRSADPVAPDAPRPVVTEIVTDMAAAPRGIPGVIVARSQVDMAFQTLGRIVERGVDIGDRVEQGALLARLDPDDLDGDVRAAEAAAAAAEVRLATSRSTAERTRALADRNVAPQAQLEQAEQALAAAEASFADAQSQLLRARDAQGFAEMRAPIAGVVSRVFASTGAVVAAGDPVLTLSGEDAHEAIIDLGDTQLGAGVAPGTVFLVSRAAADAAPVRATVDRIEPVADAQTRTRRVHLALSDARGLRLGTLIRAVRAGDGAPMLTVPAAAIIPGADAAVWIVTRDILDATVARRAIVTGERQGDRVVVADGIAAGDEVVVRGVNSLAEGQAVGRRVQP